MRSLTKNSSSPHMRLRSFLGGFWVLLLKLPHIYTRTPNMCTYCSGVCVTVHISVMCCVCVCLGGGGKAVAAISLGTLSAYLHMRTMMMIMGVMLCCCVCMCLWGCTTVAGLCLLLFRSSVCVHVCVCVWLCVYVAPTGARFKFCACVCGFCVPCRMSHEEMSIFRCVGVCVCLCVGRVVSGASF